MSEAKGIWKWINETIPGLTWKKYSCNYWGTWYKGYHLELWPTKQKFRYRREFYLGPRGYRNLVREVEGLDMEFPLWKAREAVAKEDVPKVKSDGWETTYYDIPEGVKDVDDLIVHFGLNWHMGNIVKACLRYGKKEGVTKEYDLNKIDFMLQRERKHLTNE